LLEKISWFVVMLAGLIVLACTSASVLSSGVSSQAYAPTQPFYVSRKKPMTKIPEHLQHFPDLLVRMRDRIVPAPDEIVEVAKGYPTFPNKGPWHDGRRITLMSAQTSVGINECVFVIHVAETTRPGDQLYVMGPKEVLGEEVDNQLRTRPAPTSGDPFVPSGLFDGRIEAAPAVDYNWEITEYKFDTLGQHIIVWKLGNLQSNELVVDVQS
jgi:hypothetical protein